MANVYSHQFFSVAGLNSDAYEFVPAGVIWIVRCGDFYASTGLTGGNVFMHRVGGPSFYFNHWGVEDQAYASYRGRQVFTPGQGFGVFSPDIPIDVSVSGYVLTLP